MSEQGLIMRRDNGRRVARAMTTSSSVPHVALNARVKAGSSPSKMTRRSGPRCFSASRSRVNVAGTGAGHQGKPQAALGHVSGEAVKNAALAAARRSRSKRLMGCSEGASHAGARGNGWRELRRRASTGRAKRGAPWKKPPPWCPRREAAPARGGARRRGQCREPRRRLMQRRCHGRARRGARRRAQTSSVACAREHTRAAWRPGSALARRPRKRRGCVRRRARRWAPRQRHCSRLGS